MNIKQNLQVKDGIAVISSKNMATLLGRKHLSVLRAIDAIPEQYLMNGMFLMIDDEVFISADGICMLNMSKRHLLMRQKIMMALFRYGDEYQKKSWQDFHSAIPPKIIVKLILWLDNIGAHGIALMVFRANCWFRGYSPAMTQMK